MADVLGLRFKQLVQHYEAQAPDSKRMLIETLDGLMNHLRDMMVGYENEQVLSLMKEMEGMVDIEAWDRHGRYRSLMKRTEPVDVHIKRRLDKMIVTCEQLCNIRYNSNVEEEEIVLGFDNEIETLLDQLTATSTKQLQIILITGMAGLGKTTLAITLYNHDLVKYTFDFRAWTCVSQEYRKKDLLLSILSSFIDDLTDEFYEMSEQQLGEKLYRRLKGRKYMVVFDDIWECSVWNNLKMYFPDDKTGSRVLFTSRDTDMSLHVQSARPAHVLRLRTEDESWDIFQKKVFRMGICPRGLEKSGRVINIKCKGLPLAIVIAAGLVKNNFSVAWWEQIAASLRSFMVSNPRQYIDSLALSYNHMPSHLKPCFLLFGAFPEDFEVHTTKLIRLWIAQGFIHETGNRMLEDVAEDFLMDLIKRSLLMARRIKADGQVKTCQIHDLLHDFCLRKADEENFLSNNTRYDMVSSVEIRKYLQRRYLQLSGSICIDSYKYLRILDVESFYISLFPLDIVPLINLRYLAFRAHDGSPHASISNLVNLQTLIISSRKNIVVPKTIWNMLNLRHIYIKSGENLMEDPICLQVNRKDDCPCPTALASLQPLSQVSPQSCHNIFSRTPNLRKLGFCGPLISRLGELIFPNLGSLAHLQKLKLLNTFSYRIATRSCNPIEFPEKLKKLTLSNTGMDWEEMWTFSLLPNLEILKLKFQACTGERWETGDAEFRKLKVLKLQDLDIKQWVCSRYNFPRLQRLMVYRCLKLDSVPPTLGKIFTLEMIEVNGCSLSAYRSAMNIQEEQESLGNSFLKIHAKLYS
ncbi:putative P-loop containing nucleoside triphosphate hydrolase, leucine-rich repeat domain superfamily [Helianthus annuus]|nr:putative P-loop containing nucleoside triphosphate hydrolase, leucine-rich repeat domain superfamily [Helianthus annuus]